MQPAPVLDPIEIPQVPEHLTEFLDQSRRARIVCSLPDDKGQRRPGTEHALPVFPMNRISL